VLRPLSRSLVLVSALLVAGCSSGASGPAPSPEAAPSPVQVPARYLALGDSVAAGVGAPAGRGYPAVLTGLLAERRGCAATPADDGCPLELRTVAVPGATTTTLLRDQVPVALDEIAGGRVVLVTVTIGGNDVFLPVLSACAAAPQDPTCRSAVEDALAGVDAGVDRVLDALPRSGDGPVVAVMTYDDPLPACRLAPLAPLAEQVLEGDGATAGLNDVLRTRAAEHGAVVVETKGRLRVPADFVGGRDCLHPSASGHERIAGTFLDAVGPELGP